MERVRTGGMRVVILLMLVVCITALGEGDVVSLNNSADTDAETEAASLAERVREAEKSIAATEDAAKKAIHDIQGQRDSELARLHREHSVELAAEKKQQRLEWQGLREQHSDELKKAKAEAEIKVKLSAKVLGGKQQSVDQQPEIKKLLKVQKSERDSIKSQRDGELKVMTARFAAEKKKSIAQRVKELDYTKRKFADQLGRRKEQLAFYRFQEGQLASSHDLGESAEDVDSMSAEQLRHSLIAAEARNTALSQKVNILLDADKLAAENKQLHNEVARLRHEKNTAAEKAAFLQSKLSTTEKVLEPMQDDDNQQAAEAEIAVP